MAAPGTMITGAGGKPLGFQQISAATLASATGLTAPTGTTCAYVSIDPASNGVRWRDDGTAPTTSVGMLLTAGSVLTFSGDLTALKFILVSGGSPVANISYY
jgi:hypothetical protein